MSATVERHILLVWRIDLLKYVLASEAAVTMSSVPWKKKIGTLKSVHNEAKSVLSISW